MTFRNVRTRLPFSNETKLRISETRSRSKLRSCWKLTQLGRGTDRSVTGTASVVIKENRQTEDGRSQVTRSSWRSEIRRSGDGTRGNANRRGREAARSFELTGRPVRSKPTRLIAKLRGARTTTNDAIPRFERASRRTSVPTKGKYGTVGATRRDANAITNGEVKIRG